IATGVDEVGGTDDGVIDATVGPTTVIEPGALSRVTSDGSTTVTCPGTLPVTPSGVVAQTTCVNDWIVPATAPNDAVPPRHGVPASATNRTLHAPFGVNPLPVITTPVATSEARTLGETLVIDP